MSGKAGVLEYFLGAEADRGRWWIADGKLCQKWFKWLDAQPSCMRLQQDGNKIFWRRDDGVSGTAHIVAGLPLGAESAPRALGDQFGLCPQLRQRKRWRRHYALKIVLLFLHSDPNNMAGITRSRDRNDRSGSRKTVDANRPKRRDYGLVSITSTSQNT